MYTYMGKYIWFSTLLLIDQTKEEINVLCRITATNIFGGFLGTGGAY